MNPTDLPDVSVLAAPLYLALIGLEALRIRAGRWKGRYEARDTATSLTMGAGSVVAGGLFGGIAASVLFAAWEARLATIPVSIGSLLAAFVLGDLVYYWQHRLGHRVRWFWAAHVTHHSSTRYNLGTALRQSWMGPLTGLFALNLPLVWIGFHPGMLAFVSGLNLVYQFWIHTEAIDRLPRWFEAVFNTPSHHRVHHAKNPRYLDANYAGTLIVWDRWFGTFVPEQEAEPVCYGLVHDLDSYNPLWVAYHEVIAIARDLVRPGLMPGERLRYLLAPPGWSHDGSRQTSDELKRASGIVAPCPTPLRPSPATT